VQPTHFLVITSDTGKWWLPARGPSERVEGAGPDAPLAADAGLEIDVGLGARRGLEHLAEVALVVVDGLVGADHAAGAAVDAQLRVDHVEELALPGDGVGRAAFHARGAARAVLGDDEGHRSSRRGLVACA
jgi:hypothetical protein